MTNKVMLLRVGAERGRDGGFSPIFNDDTFEFIPMIEVLPSIEHRNYNNIQGKNGLYFSEYTGLKNIDKSVHYDPNFNDVFTYGDNTSQKDEFLKLKKGDLLVFHATFIKYRNGKRLWDTKNQYIFGYFVVNESFNFEIINDILYNNYIRNGREYYEILQRDWTEIVEFKDFPKEILENAHFKTYVCSSGSLSAIKLADFVIVSGDRSRSKLLDTPILISDIIKGTYPFQLKEKYAEAWNLYNDKNNPINITKKVPHWIKGSESIKQLINKLGIKDLEGDHLEKNLSIKNLIDRLKNY